MDISRVKANLGINILYYGTEYRLSGCIIRVNALGEFFYQAEIQDLSANHSVAIVQLEDLKEEPK